MRLWGLSGGNGNSLCPQSSLCADVFLDVAFGGGTRSSPQLLSFFWGPWAGSTKTWLRNGIVGSTAAKEAFAGQDWLQPELIRVPFMKLC